MKTSSFDHKLFVRNVMNITGCTHDQAFDVLGLVVEHTQIAWMQGVNYAFDNTTDHLASCDADGCDNSNGGKLMQRELYDLLANNKPLPKGTRIKTTKGGIHTGGSHELSDDQLERANHIADKDIPFWVILWRDLHTDLIIPVNACPDRTSR